MGRVLKRLVISIVLSLALSACGDDKAPGTTKTEIPSWAKVAPEQIAEAKKHGVPVAFENDLGMRFVLIPAGTFLMGSPEDEVGRGWDEPQREVTITKPYYMQITEVTNAVYSRHKPRHQTHTYKGNRFDGEDQPVVYVSWRDAGTYAEWLSKRDGARKYVLPTEAQWELACRAESSTVYWWGDLPADGRRYANGKDTAAATTFGWSSTGWNDDGHHVTASVASYPPNRWGLHDMSGNACEWCADLHPSYATARAARLWESRMDALPCRVLRGGSWRGLPREHRCAAREFTPDYRGGKRGFRLVSPLPESGN